MNMRQPLKIQVPAQGWKQFLASRKEMLDAYDNAREKAKSHEIETYHGNVAEAEFRKWLSGFLPKRYSVTSGYVISQGRSSKEKSPHFDVIVYDSIESPVLWIEENPDTSSSGKTMAIPAEYVKCVLEVKSSFNATTVKQAIEHLSDLDALMGGPDAPDEKYKMYLPPNFFCGLIFFELRESVKYSERALSNIISGIRLRGFIGGLILRSENFTKPFSGQIVLLKSETPIQSIIGKDKGSLLNGIAMTDSIKFSDNLYFGAMLNWSEVNFSRFAFDMLAIMRGTYEAGRLSSFHGMGTSELEAI
jgi:hypothetical protein